MAEKGRSIPTAAASNSVAPNAQPVKSPPKSKKAKKTSPQEKAVPVKAPAIQKKVVKEVEAPTLPLQVLKPNPMPRKKDDAVRSSIAESSGPSVLHQSTDSVSLLPSVSLNAKVTTSSGSRNEPVDPQCRVSATEAESNSNDSETFRLAAATPIPISSAIERQFYETHLLLFVLDNVRGDHCKRRNYHGELDQDATELRRSFVDKLAYICDFKKGGSTVTAVALQKTYQGVTFWLAANETVKPKVVKFLHKILQTLKQAKDGPSKKTLEKQLMAQIVPFNEERLEYYWSILDQKLDICIERLAELCNTTDEKQSQKEITSLKKLLEGLRRFSAEKVELVKECYNARKESQAFETLSQLTASGKTNGKFFDDIRHLLGRLGEHMKAAKTIVSAALRFPALLDEFEIKIQASPPSRCYFQSPEDITLEGMASRVFSKEAEISSYQEALETLERTSNGALQAGLKYHCCFKTRVHAELLLVDLSYWKQFDFFDDDSYIGCSKPACYNCYQYILAHPGNFVQPACHKKQYLAWRTPDILHENALLPIASKIRETITSKMNSNARGELRRQINGRCVKRPPQYDSTTGTSSSIPDGPQQLLPDLAFSRDDSEPMQGLQGPPRASSFRDQSLDSTSQVNQEDESDDDLSWYRSRLEQIRIM